MLLCDRIANTKNNTSVVIMKARKNPTNSAKSLDFVKNQSRMLLDFLSDFSDEIKIIRTKLKDIPKSNYELALELYHQGNNWNALRRFKFVNKIAPNRFPLTYYYMGRIELESYQTVAYSLKMLIKSIIYTDLDMQRPADIKKAKEYFNRALKDNPSHEETQYFLKLINNPSTITYIPLSLIEEKFTVDIPSYQDFLRDIQYTTYRTLIDVVDQSLADEDRRLAIADLGCGTGLCAQYICKTLLPRTIDGIDISSSMANYCQQRDFQGYPLYDNVYHDDITSFLSLCNKKYDLLVASTVFNHIGTLDTIFENSFNALKNNGLFAFNVETHNSIKEDIIFIPEEAIFLFSHEYITKLAQKYQFDIINSTCVNIYGDVLGIQYILRKP